ncbi:hypothetical protein [Bradyrhizobium sp. JYMT SZCCT0428]|uniref:hypothetical protein n=1 Tax=Bradyrhizobium sp. JYMT SZCCT0428 TaxID=2807673 RepID=UPI001BABF350|nr:hypothetical protein [Bradyrhizobium sp. JYMT SZCCT0428]MBR1154479.1 hypothetical protein [Bradyrhizobium sp. JYMT SZCCT0428]
MTRFLHANRESTSIENAFAADNTTAPAKPRLTTPAEAAILTKRMSEALTPKAVMRGLDPRIHQSS